jgi:DNA-binding NarL/FixJ family response regulator
MTPPTVLLADDHVLILEGLKALLDGHASVLATYGDAESLLEGTRALRPEVVITDVSMPGMSGIDYVRTLKDVAPRPRVIILSMYGTDALVRSAFDAGADGYIPKHAAGEELLAALREVMAGRRYVSPLVARHTPIATPSRPAAPPSQLTRRQREVLQRVAAGKRMKEIAAELKVSRRTVEMHKYHMMKTLGVRTSAELIRYFLRNEAGDSEP